MKRFLILALLVPLWVRAEPAVAPKAVEEGTYEIDYEEEPGASDEAEADVEVEAPKKRKGLGGNSGGPAVQGSRAKNRFAPILKSETKSYYKKEGKSLDVDTD